MAKVKFANEEEAIDALNNSFLKFEAAVNYLTAQDPNHPALAPFKGREVSEIKEERAREVIHSMSMDDEFWAASSYMQQIKDKSKENAQAAEAAERVESAVKEENNINLPPENSEAVERNQAYLTQKFAELEEKDENGEPKWYALTSDARSKIHAVDDDNSHSEELQKKTEETIWETTKTQIFSTRAFDFNFMGLNERDKTSLLKSDVADVYAEHVANIVGVTPVLDEKQDENEELIHAAKARAEASLAAINEFLSQNNAEKATVKKSAVIASAVHASKKLDNVIAYAKSKNYSKRAIAGFKLFGNKFSEKMKSFWGMAYTGAKEYVSNNKSRVVVDGIATLAVALSPVSYPVVGAYAAYATIGAFVWPVVEKKNKMQNALKRQGQSTKGYGGYTGLKKAWASLKDNKKEWKRYKNRALMGAAAGVVVGGIIGAAATHYIQGVSAVATKVAATVTRAASSVTSQFMNWRDSKQLAKLENTAENRADLKNAKWGLIIGVAIAAASAAFSIFSFLHSDTADVNTNDMGGKGGKAQDIVTGGKGAKRVAKAAAKLTGEPAPGSDVTVPDAWKASMGITAKQWDYIHTEVTPMHIGNFDETYLNTVNAQAAHPEIFVNPDGTPMTPEQVMWETSRIMSLAKARPDGHGGLIARFWDPNGQEVYANGNHEFFYDKNMTKPVEKGVECLPRCNGDEKTVKAFQDLYKMINCGNDIKGVDGARIKQFFDETMANGQYKGEGWNIGVTNNVMDRDGCDDIHFIRGKPIAPKTPDVIDQPPAAITTVRKDGTFDHTTIQNVTLGDGQADQSEVSDNISTGRTATDRGSNNVNDSKALEGTTPGTTQPLEGTKRNITPNYPAVKDQGGMSI